MALKRLPLGIQDFGNLIENNCVYIDKTELISKLIQEGKAYFLSRPRRFGKSLLISTLEALFRNRRELFKGLWIDESDYDWQEYPVIRLDMSAMSSENLEAFKTSLLLVLKRIAADYKAELPDNLSTHDYFRELISELGKIGKVVVLIDEYDKPLLNKLTKFDEACQIRDFLRDFYTIIKSQDANLKFILLTGVSKFSKVSVFSGINNLTDITMANAYGTLLGYTEAEIHKTLDAHVKASEHELEMDSPTIYAELKKWYNGYKFSAKSERVYNPFSVLSLLTLKDFKNYWFETGTPTFLVELLQKNSLQIPQLENLEVSEDAFSTYDIEHLSVLPLLYQTGYLTVKDFNARKRIYDLGYPNFEVKTAFLQILLEAKGGLSKADRTGIIFDLSEAIEKNDLELFFKTLKSLFAKIPYDLHHSSESYYQTIFYLTFTLLGQIIDAEVRTNLGRIDAVLKFENKIYIFEFKMDKSAKEALEQIDAKKYPEAFADSNCQLTKIGISFSSKDRNIVEWVIGS